MRRRGLSLLEVVVAVAVAVMVIGMGWSLYVSLAGRSTRVAEYGDVLTEVARLRALLLRDLRAARVDPGAPATAFLLEADGRELRLDVTAPAPVPVTAPAPAGSTLVTWRLVAAPGGAAVFQREADDSGPPETFDRLPAGRARMRVERDSTGAAVALIEAEFTLPARGKAPSRAFPLKLVQRAGAPPVLGARRPFPGRLLGVAAGTPARTTRHWQWQLGNGGAS